MHKTWRLNTSNRGKLAEYRRFFQQQGYSLLESHIDLAEIDSDPTTVVVYKASHIGENILVEDTSLDVEGANIGIHVKWLENHLEELHNRKALWISLLAYQHNQKVYVFKGATPGTITKPRGTQGFGFDPYFIPIGQTKTLAEEKPDHLNARAHAVQALLNNQPTSIHNTIPHWHGNWQSSTP